MWMRLMISLPVVVSLSLLLAVDRGLGEVGPLIPGTPTVQTSVRNNTPLPGGCALEEVVTFLTGFLDAFNRGDKAALARFFPTVAAYPYADKPGFQWYSVTDLRGHFVTYDPAALPAYFAARHQQHEQLQLLELEVAGSWQPRVDIVFHLRQQADDVPPRTMIGKGAIDCDERTIFVWSMAQHMAVTQAGPPEP
jgi:hypothetical protein